MVEQPDEPEKLVELACDESTIIQVSEGEPVRICDRGRTLLMSIKDGVMTFTLEDGRQATAQIINEQCPPDAPPKELKFE